MKKGQGFARRVTPENLVQFKPLLTAAEAPTPSAAVTARATGPTSPDPAVVAAKALFKGESVRWPVPFKHPSMGTRPPGETASTSIVTEIPVRPTPTAPATSAPARGPLLWTKRLVASDVGQQPGHPTGGVRLTQAGFTVKRKVIDQTTYFRHTVFGGRSWRVIKTTPKVEQATAKFDVTLLGKSLGVHTLAVSHKPSGEAGQGNYTSILHWGDLNSAVRKLPLIGRRIRLYAPLPGRPEPYFVEVV